MRDTAAAPQLERLITRATSLLASCTLCEHQCRVNRLGGELGRCGLDRYARCFSEGINLGEFDVPSPTHAVYLSGCGLRCVDCWAKRDVEQPGPTDPDLPRALGARIRARAPRVRSLSFIGGSPTVNLPAILASLAAAGTYPPVVWNCDLYATPAVVELLREFVSLFVIDLKFGNDRCATTLARVPRYLDVLHRNLAELPADRLVIRHLLRPGHHECCFQPAMRWVATHTPRARVSLLANYRVFGSGAAPAGSAPHLAPDELDRCRAEVRRWGLALAA